MFSITVGKPGYMPDADASASTIEEARELLIKEIEATQDYAGCPDDDFIKALELAKNANVNDVITFGYYVHTITVAED